MAEQVETEANKDRDAAGKELHGIIINKKWWCDGSLLCHSLGTVQAKLQSQSQGSVQRLVTKTE